MRVLCSGKTLAFQANDASSILATRSTSCKSVALSSLYVSIFCNVCLEGRPNGRPFKCFLLI